MGRTNQVLTGGSIFSTSPQTTTMKIVLALLVLCLFQFSLAELEDVDNAETNLVLERDIREAAKIAHKEKRGSNAERDRRKEKAGRARKEEAKNKGLEREEKTPVLRTLLQRRRSSTRPKLSLDSPREWRVG